MKTKLSDLTEHLFAQLERLSNENITPEQLEEEVKRAQAIVGVADRITGNAELQLKAAKLFSEHGPGVLPMLPLIGSKSAGESSQ